MSERTVVSEDEAYELLAHLVASAELCIREPYYYGTFRLIDAASKLMGFMLQNGGDGDRASRSDPPRFRPVDHRHADGQSERRCGRGRRAVAVGEGRSNGLIEGA